MLMKRPAYKRSAVGSAISYPRQPGQVRLRSVEYVRHGTRCLTAGLFVHTGTVVGMVTSRRPNEVFVDFLNLLTPI